MVINRGTKQPETILLPVKSIWRFLHLDEGFLGGHDMSSILAVGAHPDDVEVGCFGTLLKHRKNGDCVNVALTTKGGYGSRTWETILAELEEAQSYLGLRYIMLDNPIGHYGMTWKTVGELDDIIREHNVDTVYSVWHGDSHQDHQATFRNVLAACRTKNVKNLYCYELPEYSYRSQQTFQPRRFVDVSDTMEEKLKAVSAYRTYFNEHSKGAIKGLASHRGGACGVQYAEAFEIIFEVWK